MGKKENDRYLVSNGSGYFYMYTGGMGFTTDKNQAVKFRSIERAQNHMESIKSLRKCYIENFRTGEREEVDKEICSSARRAFPKDVRLDAYRKTHGRCAICGEPIEYATFTIDHIIPLSKGGTNYFENLQPTCRVCNQIKQDMLLDELMGKLMKILIYNTKSNYCVRYSREFSKIQVEHRRKCVGKITEIIMKTVVR